MWSSLPRFQHRKLWLWGHAIRAWVLGPRSQPSGKQQPHEAPSHSEIEQKCTEAHSKTNILNWTPYCRERAREFSRSRPVANIYLKTGSATSQIYPKFISLYWTWERRGAHRSSLISSRSVKAKPWTLLAGHLSVPISHVHFVLLRWEKSSAFFQHQCHRNVNIQQKIHSWNRITSPLKKPNN